MIDNRITLSDENGKEVEMEILLTFDDEEKGIHYVLIHSSDPNDDTVLPYRYDEDGNLEPVDDPEGFEMCNEVLGAYLGELNNE
ncbi:MAG: DUF1292 domain-containing protein [Solobacterium sp.]|jgi:uncharacterized protein YrzB (UPF0473 family)|nr:DUF1292 domain-containing protein [Solobacterium sp.]MBQ8068274.1 DUF1292 domain-containing protein [Solobacterium sp.]